jgi:hypothetical protein
MTSYGQNVRISDNPLFSDESVSDMEICSPRNQVPNIKECTRELNQDDKGHIPSSTTTASSHVVNTPDKNDVSFRRLGKTCTYMGQLVSNRINDGSRQKIPGSNNLGFNHHGLQYKPRMLCHEPQEFHHRFKQAHLKLLP